MVGSGFLCLSVVRGLARLHAFVRFTGIASLVEANETETDPDEVEDNLKYIAMGAEKPGKFRKLFPEL